VLLRKGDRGAARPENPQRDARGAWSGAKVRRPADSAAAPESTQRRQRHRFASPVPGQRAGDDGETTRACERRARKEAPGGHRDAWQVY